MSRISSHIILSGLVLILLGFINVTVLLCGLDGIIALIIPLLITALGAWALYRYNTTQPSGVRSLIIASCTILFITIPCCRLITPHASWDGLSNWNLIAKYYSSTEGLNHLFKPAGPTHADYPPGLPGIISFFWRAFHTTSEWFPFLLSFAYLAGLSLLIAIEASRRHLVYGIVILLALGTCPQYISQGLRQCADIPLAFYFVSALVALEAYKYNNNRFYLLCAISAIAALPLIKNDGLLIALSLLLFHAKLLFRKSNLTAILLILLPVLAFLFWYKSMAPPNDLTEDFGTKGWKRITDPYRYIIIIRYLWQSLAHSYLSVTLLIVLLAIIQKRKHLKASGSQLSIILVLCGYLAIYLTSSYPLDWLIGNSIDRLLIHILPAWVLASSFAIWKPSAFNLEYRRASE